MQQQWVATFVARLTTHSLLSLDEAIEVAARVYAQASRLAPEAAADYVLQSGLIRRLDKLNSSTPQAMHAEATPDRRGSREGGGAGPREEAASDPVEGRRRDDAPSSR